MSYLGSENSSVTSDNAHLEEVHVVPNQSGDSDVDSEWSDENNSVMSYCFNCPSDESENALHVFLDDVDPKQKVNKSIEQFSFMLFISPSTVIDQLDKKGMCILHKLLAYFLNIKFKDKDDTDMIEIILTKSNLDYERYKEGIVLNLLQKYDKSLEPKSIKFLQWQILSRKGETMIVKMIQQENPKGNDKIFAEAKKFASNIQRTIHKETYLDDIIQSIFASGSLELLKYVKRLIDDEEIKLATPIIHNAVFWGPLAKPENIKHFQKCFVYLLDCDKKLVNSMFPLCVALIFNDDFMVKTLLAKGASISVLADRDLPFQNINFETLKGFFDSLVKSTPKRFLKDENVWKMINAVFKEKFNLDGFIFIDYKSFKLPVFDESEEDGEKGDILSEESDDEMEFDDLQLIDFLSESPRLCRLIDHPILAILLEMHWSRFKKWIVFDQISVVFMLLMFIVFVVKYAVKSTIAEETCHILDFACAGVCGLFLLLEVLKNYKIFHLVFIKITNMFKCAKEKRQIRNFPTYQTTTSVFLKIPVLILIIIYAMKHCDTNSGGCNQTIGVASILFSINCTLLIAYFSQTVAHYVIMFLYVAFNGFKFILSMFLILLGFGIGLLMLIKNFEYGKEDGDDVEHANTTEDPFIPLSTNNPRNSDEIIKKSDWVTVGLGVFRAFIMSTGELEVSSFEFHAIISYVVFMFFIFVVPIVFFNLLNGLAIEDISIIKKEAMYLYRKAQLKVLYEFEQLNWKV